MKELSIFIDESGDFGEYEQHSPYYIITMVFHDQAIPISEAVARLAKIATPAPSARDLSTTFTH